MRLQGQISDFSRSIEAEVKGAMPYNVKLDFVRGAERAELLSDNPLVIVRIRDRRDDDRNIVHAALAFCPVGLLPKVRPYLGKAMSSALDVTITRKLLNSLKHYSALSYLHQEVLPDLVGANPDLKEACETLDYLDQQGLFTRVLLRELRDFGASAGTVLPQEGIAKEILGFIRYLYRIASRPPGEDVGDPGYQGAYISTAIMLVGISQKIRLEGSEPYLRHLHWLQTERYEKVLLAGRDNSIPMTKEVAHIAEQSGIVRRTWSKAYKAKDTAGDVRRHVLIELDVVEGAASHSPAEDAQG